MENIFTEIELSNPREQQLTSIKVNALATGSENTGFRKYTCPDQKTGYNVERTTILE